MYIQRFEDLTLKNVLDKVYNVAELRKYLPDFEDKPDKRLNREFVFSIINKLDPTFFNRVHIELDQRAKKARPSVDKVQTIKVQPELLKILQDAKKAQTQRESVSNTRALTAALTTTKKRKRRERNQDGPRGIETTMNVKRMRTE